MPYRVIYYLILFLLMLPSLIIGQSSRFITVSNVRARSLALGGAFTSVVDDMPAAFYNPACYDLYKIKKQNRLTFFLNPVSPVVFGFEKNKLFTGYGTPEDDVLLTLSHLLKSISLSLNSLEVGLILGEQNIQLPSDFYEQRLFPVSGFRQNHSHAIVGRFKLADQVSIGAAANLIYSNKNTKPNERYEKISVSYGILLKAEKGLQIGVSLVDLPDSLKGVRLPLERIVDEAVNVGISYRLWDSTLSLDVRNLGEEKEEAVREFHVGYEQFILSHIALRTGWYKKTNGGNVYSFGIGLINGNGIWNSERMFGHQNIFLNYAFIYENEPINDNKWHFLSFFIRI